MPANPLLFILPFTVTNPTTTPILQLATPAGLGLQILELVLGQTGTTTSAQTELTIQRRSSASTLPTAAAVSPLDTLRVRASGLTLSTTTNAYGIASATGTAGVILQRLTFNVVGNGLYYVPTPDSIIAMDVSSFLTLQFPTAPPNAVYTGHLVLAQV